MPRQRQRRGRDRRRGRPAQEQRPHQPRKILLHVPRGGKGADVYVSEEFQEDNLRSEFVKDAIDSSHQLRMRTLRRRFRTGEPIWMNTEGLSLDDYVTMRKRISFDIYFPKSSEYWNFTTLSTANRAGRRSYGNPIRGRENEIILYVERAIRQPLYGSSLSSLLSVRYSEPFVTPTSSELAEQEFEDFDPAELKLLGLLGNARGWDRHWYSGISSVNPSSSGRRAGRAAQDVSIETILSNTLFSQVVPELVEERHTSIYRRAGEIFKTRKDPARTDDYDAFRLVPANQPASR